MTSTSFLAFAVAFIASSIVTYLFIHLKDMINEAYRELKKKCTMRLLSAFCLGGTKKPVSQLRRR